ncbi:MAG TPA: penicillin acylase family protein [Ktedonobacteraceae bacterium]|nr:penicillin acylase family protein [Ktedonobacteraceae bacterium]
MRKEALLEGEAILKERPRSVWRILNLGLSCFVLILLLWVAAFGAGSLPPLGVALNPGTGLWNIADRLPIAHSETWHFPQLQQPVTILFEQSGVAHIQAHTDADLFWAMGYLHARFRLTQMDIVRRRAEGRLSEVLGADAISSDRFELSLGLQRSASADWQLMPPSSPAHQALLAYAQGVNTSIHQQIGTHTLPLLFQLLHYEPQDWTPIDSLAIQESLVETLNFSSAPLDDAMRVQSLGYQRAMQWFPILPSDVQHPYDPGPYQTKAALEPLAEQQQALDEALPSVADLSQYINQLPSVLRYHAGSSNGWAVNGFRSSSGKAMLGGDPHLDLTLPSIWYQVEATSPDYTFQGVGVPGLPTILIGKNQSISWTITNTQNQSTLYYLEKTDAAHADQYYWNGAWHRFKHIHEVIPVKGGTSLSLDIKLSVHGPVLATQRFPSSTIAVTWMGAQSMDEVDNILALIQAKNFAQFRDALRTWVAPALTFVYADNQGNIGLLAPGAYPIVRSGSPWLPLPGTGEADVMGMIPFAAIPQVYDPPEHFVFAANQRPVGPNYPYYVGTTFDNFENGYRADEIYQQLSTSSHMTVKDMERLQNDTHDYLATLILPRLLAELQQQAGFSVLEQRGLALLQGWNGEMNENEVAPSLWWTFWQNYLQETFGPWWQASHVPADRFPSLAIGTDQAPLSEDLENWTLHDAHNPAFSLPSGLERSASDVMVLAYKKTIAQLTKQLGARPELWLWGKLHTRLIPSLFQIDELGAGPFPSAGDDWTVNAADNMVSTHGPSWRMIVDWATGQTEGIYPGGQDEDPLSPWYQNQIAIWLQGRYLPLLQSSQVSKLSRTIRWQLLP